MVSEIIYGLGISYLILFILSTLLKDNSIVDIFWGLGFLQVTIHSMYVYNAFNVSNFLLLFLIFIWSLRISSHIFSKWLKRGHEDARYAKWRKEWKYFYTRSIFQVYILQGILLMIVSTAIILHNMDSFGLTYLSLVAVLISLFGLIYESIADMELSDFLKTKKKGEIMTKGLWKYSRHPNYFGESVFWLGISLFAITSSIFSLISFLMITFLLRFVSGVPMAERNYLDNKEFQKYMKKTPPMFPNFFIK